jgi:hypothetical protein
MVHFFDDQKSLTIGKYKLMNDAKEEEILKKQTAWNTKSLSLEI